MENEKVKKLILLMAIIMLTGCSENKKEENIHEDIEALYGSIPTVGSYMNFGLENEGLITDIFNFKYKNLDYCLVVARASCGASCGYIHLVVYEVKDDFYSLTNRLFPKYRFKNKYYPNGSVDIGVFTLFRNTPNLDDLTAFTAKIEFNPKTRIVTYDEFIEDDSDGYIYPTGKKVSWELKEYE